MTFDSYQIGNCVFTISVSDVITRFAYPMISNTLKISSRFMFMFGVAGLGVVRIVFLHMNLENYQLLLIVCAVLGFFRALTVVNQVLILCEFCEENCPTKLPGTLGLSVVIKSIMLVIFGWMFHGMSEMSLSLTMNFYSQVFLFMILILIWLLEDL